MGMIILAGLVVFGLGLWGAAVFLNKRNKKIDHLIGKAESHLKFAQELEIESKKLSRQALDHRASAQIYKDELSVMGVKVD